MSARGVLPPWKPARYRERHWRRGTMQARRIHFQTRAWEYTLAWLRSGRWDA